MQARFDNLPLTLVHRLVAILLAINYFTFQIEPFEEEYEANHRRVSETCAVDAPSLTWESFDKDNAQKAFILEVDIFVDLLLLLPAAQHDQFQPVVRVHPIRDKSPPSPFQFFLVIGRIA